KSYTCSVEVTVDNTVDNLILKCSVESKPQATFTWSTKPALSGPLVNSTDCVQDNTNLVYTCTNTLTLPSDKVIQTGKIVVTCDAEAAGNTTDICVTLVPLMTTQAITTTAETTSTVATTRTVGTTSTVEITSTTKAAVTTEATSTITSPISNAAPGVLQVYARMKLINVEFKMDMANNKSQIFKDFNTTFCASVSVFVMKIKIVT
ncbi:hypothetical protein NP493_985g00004, partial [Ridgeia piscesae]